MSELIDDRNSDLWNKVNESHEIEVYKTDKLYYSITTKNDKSFIDVPNSNVSSAGFTHELLHIFLYTEGFYVAGTLIVALDQYHKLSEKFPYDLFHYVGNCLEHQKMLPHFLEMKFNIEDFIYDYYINKLTDADIVNIKKLFSSKKNFRKIYYSKGIHCYIKTYFSVIGDPNENFNHKENLKKLKKLDVKLYQILENCWTEWKKVNNKEYVHVLRKFIFELENWSKNKKIINNHCY